MKGGNLRPQNFGGASRDRTGDLLHAMQALSQLSYSPRLRRATLPARPRMGQAKTVLAPQEIQRAIQALQGLFAPE